MSDSTAGLNSEKSTSLILEHFPAIFMIYIASSLLSPPKTLGAETPGIHLQFMESTSNEINICAHYFYNFFKI